MTGPTIPIADSAEDLTPSWLTAALSASRVLDGARVVDAECQPIGTGQMCDCVRLDLHYDRATDAPKTIVAKLPAADETSRATAKALRSYENEVRFYQQLAPELPIRTPQAYYADIEVESASFVLLLEDLAPAQQGDQLLGCSPGQAQIALQELVKLHASRWGDPTLADIEWLHGDKAANQQFLASLLPGLWEGFRDRYATDLSVAVTQAGSVLFSDIEAYLLADPGPSTVVHGDYRLDNLLFDPTPGGVPVAVVDWQLCTDGPGMNDVAYFIGAGLGVDQRRSAEADLVHGYHTALASAGVTDYAWDQCWQEYRRGTWSGLIMAVAASMLVERTTRGDQMFLTMADRHSRHALDLDAAEVI
ncbi:MAG TPA: phosphotransferase [Acidimicrobiales bacterium]|nr:phosphotransferase [Acidimicrobiales bacterium]HLN42841.1 phosphotransferase [Acidimicrobiales bacterium]